MLDCITIIFKGFFCLLKKKNFLTKYMFKNIITFKWILNKIKKACKNISKCYLFVRKNNFIKMKEKNYFMENTFCFFHQKIVHMKTLSHLQKKV